MANRKSKLLVPLAALIVGVVGVVVLVMTKPVVQNKPQPDVAPLVRVLPVAPRSIDFVVRAHGTVVPRREGDLVSQVAGAVVWVSPALASGGFFDEGEPLVRIDRADYEVALESARANVARAESEADRASRRLARQKRLSDRSVSAEADYDDARNGERVATAVLREARSKLEQAQRNLLRTELTAPYAGRVRRANVDVGQFVSRGGVLGRIYAVDFAEVRLPIPDAELSYLNLPLLFRGEAQQAMPGPSARLRARFAGQEHVWQGEVVRTEGEIDPRSRMVHIVVRVADPYGQNRGPGEADRPPLAVGLFVEAAIFGRRVEGAVALPRTALRGDNRVLVVDEAERLRTREVSVVRIEGDHIVVGAGLEAGERVVISPMPAMMEGMAVRVLEDDGADASMRSVGIGEAFPSAVSEESS